MVGSVQSNVTAGVEPTEVPECDASRIGWVGLRRDMRRRAVLPEEPVMRIVIVVVGVRIKVGGCTGGDSAGDSAGVPRGLGGLYNISELEDRTYT